MQKKVLVSAVIVTYNGKDLLKTAMDSIIKIKDIACQLVVVDNNSSDGSIDFIKKNYKNAKIVKNRENLGYTGINSALPYCNGKYILFLNNDVKLDKNCIKELLNAVEKDSKIAMAAPRLVNYYNQSLKSAGTWASRAFYAGHMVGDSKEKEIPYLGVGLIRKDIVNKFGYLFDNDYFIYGEDLDLGLRLRLLGYKIIFAPEAILYHMHAMTTAKGPSHKMTFLLERNLLMTFFKVLSFKNILLLMPYVLFMRLIAMLKDIASLNFNSLLARLHAILWIVFNFDSVLEKRSKLQKLRKADDKFVLKAFSEKHLLEKRVLI